MANINEDKTIPKNQSNNEIKKEILEQTKKSFCRIYKNEFEWSFGFFCKISDITQQNFLPVLITNNKSIDLTKNKIIQISLNDGKDFNYIQIDNSRIIYTFKNYDIIVIEIKPNIDKINDFLEFDDKINDDMNQLKNIFSNKLIYTINLGENDNLEINQGISKGIDKDILYVDISKKKNLSCSPIFLDNFKIIGFFSKNSYLSCFNKIIIKGIFAKYPLKKISLEYEKKLHKNVLNELTIIYKVEEKKKIQIFNETFVNNNKHNCIIIIEREEIRELCSEINISENKITKNNLEIKLFEYKTINNMNKMFAGCSSLISIPDFEQWDFNNVQEIEYMFKNCSSLTYLSKKFKINGTHINNNLD